MERIYDALRQRIVGGELLPGARLDPSRLAADLNSSATPVRDALHRLLGEQLVAAWPQEGFHVPICSEGTLRDLHGWSLDILFAAARPAIPTSYRRPEDMELPRSDDHAERVDALFDAIVSASGNLQHREAMADVNARLHAYRRIEPHLIHDTADEVDKMTSLWTRGDSTPLRQALASYHKRRVRLVPDIAAVVRARMRG
jgi:DNA-binding GntR family transcriptional regulator